MHYSMLGSGKKPNATTFALRHKDLSESSVVGRPMDVALVKWVETVCHYQIIRLIQRKKLLKIANAQKLREQYDIVFEVPFNSQRRYHLVIVCDHSTSSNALDDEGKK